MGTEIYEVIKPDPGLNRIERDFESFRLVEDLCNLNQKVLAARGGAGGKGNFNHRSVMTT